MGSTQVLKAKLMGSCKLIRGKCRDEVRHATLQKRLILLRCLVKSKYTSREQWLCANRFFHQVRKEKKKERTPPKGNAVFPLLPHI